VSYKPNLDNNYHFDSERHNTRRPSTRSFCLQAGWRAILQIFRPRGQATPTAVFSTDENKKH
jgi:hypothetical protein